MRMKPSVIELLTSDPAIFLMCGVGLMMTAFSIVRDTRTQRQRGDQQVTLKA